MASDSVVNKPNETTAPVSPSDNKETKKGTNSKLTDDQWEDLKEAFTLFDTDRSGTIDSNELKTVLQTLGLEVTDKEVEDMAADIDLNKDGEIDFDEFVRLMERRVYLPSNEAEYFEAFKFFDKNNNGVIEFEELKDVLQSLGEQLTDQDIWDMIHEADKNGDNVIDFEEFMQMMSLNDVINLNNLTRD
ncbi:hypothetical protein RFI_23867 [Reticulomyxa filosa]|uniref:Calmodulin n=1 Tax=Reticulomyxa filosa TaxID=46433 RepID=X6MI11_RETFI|nr:hypothetical protein RFI_23867 [Reticulomyxa filosa]|eukprot:ETO13499.1 hypothetical protein RFI_23867 [Reticulomyxa filosa]